MLIHFLATGGLFGGLFRKKPDEDVSSNDETPSMLASPLREFAPAFAIPTFDSRCTNRKGEQKRAKEDHR